MEVNNHIQSLILNYATALFCSSTCSGDFTLVYYHQLPPNGGTWVHSYQFCNVEFATTWYLTMTHEIVPVLPLPSYQGQCGLCCGFGLNGDTKGRKGRGAICSFAVRHSATPPPFTQQNKKEKKKAEISHFLYYFGPNKYFLVLTL